MIRFSLSFSLFVAVLSFCASDVLSKNNDEAIRLEGEELLPAKLPKKHVFLVVDIDHDGPELLTLENSNIYFDVDGDELAERTEWIHPDDGFLAVFSIEDYKYLKSVDEIILGFFSNGMEKIKANDKNKDGVYNNNDHDVDEGLAFFISQDKESRGFPDATGKRFLACEFQKFEIGKKGMPHTLFCTKGKKYKVYEKTFEYEDSNVFWNGLCEMLAISPDKEVFKKRCTDRGFKLQ